MLNSTEFMEFVFSRSAQRKQGHILSYHAPKRKKSFLRKSTQKSVKILLQIQNSVTNMEILAPELVGDQSEMVV